MAMTLICFVLKVVECVNLEKEFFSFKCARAEELFNMLQEIMQNNSVEVVVVEEPVVERNSQQTELEVLWIPRTPTTPGLGAQNLPNGYPCYPSFGDASSHFSSRRPSVGSARLPSISEESTHPLLVAEEQVHTYVNTTGVQAEQKNHASVHVPPEARVSNLDGNTPKEEPSSTEDRDPCMHLKPEGVCSQTDPCSEAANGKGETGATGKRPSQWEWG